MTGKLLTEHHLEFLSLKGDCTGSSESTLVKMPHCWKSHVVAQLLSNMTITDHLYKKVCDFMLKKEFVNNVSCISFVFHYIFKIAAVAGCYENFIY